MLAEGFLRLLCYREEKKFASKRSRRHTDPRGPEPSGGPLPDSAPAILQVQETQTGPNQEDLDSMLDLKGAPLVPRGLSIPAGLAQLPVCIEDCSLLEQYPDLQVADSGRISHNLSRSAAAQHGLPAPDCQAGPPPEPGAALQRRGGGLPALPVPPDQGYLAMGQSADLSLDLPGSGLEPMSNSVLNGLLEKQLEEVYMQHLTDNLARCNSHLGNSLLHGLVPPLPPPPPLGGPDSLAPSVEERGGGQISYLNTHNLGACSSNFSSPVLRISEPAGPHPP